METSPTLRTVSSSASEGVSTRAISTFSSKLRDTAALLLMAFAAVLVHGYHLGADDAAIYVPAVKKVADPTLYPFGSEFFLSHAHLSLFSNIVGGSARLTRLPADTAIFAWHIAGIFLLLAACWKLAGVCFESRHARWAAVATVAAGLSVPVAGTALVVMDPYLTARSLSTPATVFAIACYMMGQRKRALGWLALAGLVHVQMAMYAVVLMGLLELVRRRRETVFAALPFVFPFGPASGPAREALHSRTFFFLYNWAWYEWIGAVAPLAILAWLSTANLKGATPAFRGLARTLAWFGLLFAAGGMVLSSSVYLENYTRLQPMRAFQLLYAVFLVMLGGLLGEYVLKRVRWRWFSVMASLAAGMWIAQQAAYPASPHVEWPGMAYRNSWDEAFLWIRHNTPKDAVFALDPDYMMQPGEDQHGFRAVAERSVLADDVKDSGAVSLFPQLARDWNDESQAQHGWSQFRAADFRRLAQEYPVSWVVVQGPGAPGLVCPYSNMKLAVCRLDETAARGMKR
jgi:Domain of unknown function (DUF6798)